MSSENVARKKKNTSDSSTPVPDGDHRKRRRNRTTQSCLNCHTSKRMCDRKRPACARCTQLGLTGLCVYEVDDPTQRTDVQDESSRLIKRVAELEGVIRELKNKPHPRWSQSHLQGSDESSSSNAPSPPMSSSSSEKGDISPRRAPSVAACRPTGAYPLYWTPPQSSFETHRKSQFLISPQESTPSPGLMTPTDEFPFSPAGIAMQGANQDYDLTSMLWNYSGLMGFNDNGFPTMGDSRGVKTNPSNTCTCIHEPASYNTMLELSIRLRKASDILGQSSSHHQGGSCHLHQRISELDSYTINALSDVSTGPRGMLGPDPNDFLPSQMYSQRATAGIRAPPPNSNTRPWDLSIPSTPGTNPPVDDSFMSWEPPRRS